MRRRLSVVALLAAAASATGCDTLLGLQHLPEPPAIDAPIDTDPAADRDGDGVADSDDNCIATSNADQADSDGDHVGDVCDNCTQTINFDQHDEDADGIGDICDNCPGHPNPDQLNTDGDQVGDACDSSAALDCIARFDGFQTMGDWSGVRGTWIVESDHLVQTDPEVAQGLAVTAATFTNPRVEISASPFAFGSAGSHHVGMWPLATPTGGVLPDGVVAELFDNAGVTYMNTGAIIGGTPTILPGSYATLAPTTNMPSGSRVRITCDLRAAPVWSTVGSLNSSNAVQSGNNAPGGTRQVGLRAHSAIVRYDWVWVVVRGTNSCPPRS